MNTQYAPAYDTADDTTRAERLPSDFGHDNPEVIRLTAIRDDLRKELADIQKTAYDFNNLKIGLIGELDQAACEIAEIDRRRPQQLAAIFSGDGDFTPDDEAQKRRAELQLRVERINLVISLLENQSRNLKDKVHAVHFRHHSACHDVDVLLAKLRLAHVSHVPQLAVPPVPQYDPVRHEAERFASLRKLAAQELPAHDCSLRREILAARKELGLEEAA